MFISKDKIEDVFFNLTIDNNILEVKIAYTFLPETLDEEIKLDKKLNFKKEINDKSISDLKLLFNITPENTFNVDFEGTEYLRKANRETLKFVQKTVGFLLENIR